MKDMNPYQGMVFSQRGTKLCSLREHEQTCDSGSKWLCPRRWFEVALMCDIIYASDKAKVGFPETTLGIFPGFGGTQRAAKLCGLAKAKELIFTGKMINAQEAYEIGLINKVVPHEELWKEVMALAEKIRANGPVSTGLAKALINKSLFLDMNSALMLEAKDFGLCFGTKDQKEGMTAFVEKRKATFTGE